MFGGGIAVPSTAPTI